MRTETANKSERFAFIGRLVVAGLAGVSVLAMAIPAFAQKPFLDAVKGHLQLSAAIAKCTFCHGAKKGPSKTNLNDFGKAIQADPDAKPLLNSAVRKPEVTPYA